MSKELNYDRFIKHISLYKISYDMFSLLPAYHMLYHNKLQMDDKLMVNHILSSNQNHKIT